MTYYTLTPFKKQYFFPENFKDYSLFDNFYNPYSLKAKIYFWLWRRFSLIRFCCRILNIEDFLSIDILDKFNNNNVLIAYNTGTLGTEQKITALGVNIKTKEEFFLKYADNKFSVKNVKNETSILLQLKTNDFAPTLIESFSSEYHSYFKTNVIKGNRNFSHFKIDKVLKLVIKISEQDINAENKSSSNLKLCFSHGDFTPWNMMLHKGNFKVYDWESAGYYTLGYDLFTYLIQPFILLKTHKSFLDLINQNKFTISKYFKNFKIQKWEPYLIAFIECKIKLTSGNDIHKDYLTIIKYYKK